MKYKYFEEIDYATYELNEGDAIPDSLPSYARISVPTDTVSAHTMMDKNLVLVDRTVEVKVSLRKNDFSKCCRMDVLYSDADQALIEDIASRCFEGDHRFYVTDDPNREILANCILKQWLQEQNMFYQCMHEDRIVGFADIRRLEEVHNAPFVYLAAVEKEYRSAGAAMSLYAYIFQTFKDQGEKFVYGRISTRNMSVMNLYASFGALFEKPLDVFVKR